MYQLVSKRIVREVYKKRNLWSHKYDYGSLLVISGSKTYTGSPLFNALAALRAGVDLVTIVAPKRVADVAASFLPDIIAYPLDCEYFNTDCLREVVSFAKKSTAVVIGGGMGRKKETFEFVLEFIKKINKPLVIDADAIHAVAKNRDVIKGKSVLITPHAKEFFVLTGKPVNENTKERAEIVKSEAKELETTILLKGYIDVISDGEKVFLNKTGTPYMTKGGTGDILAGIAGALMARGVDPLKAACASAWINGKAGEIASKKHTEALIASDVLEEIKTLFHRNKFI